jgi:hypothetical protein
MLRCTPLALTLTILFGLSSMHKDAAGKPAVEVSDINRIMKQAHLTPGNRGTRDNLDNKVIDGKATDAEKKELLELYTALSKTDPPKGSADAWKERTDELVASLKAVYKGEEKAVERFSKARDCKSCHETHRLP